MKKVPKEPNIQVPKAPSRSSFGCLGNWVLGSRRARRGLSLLEVILALAILALSLAAIGELIRIGTISASRAEDYTEAQILAESKLAEIMSGALAPDPVARSPFVNNPDWVYTIELAATEETEVMALCVTVEKYLDRARPLAFSLTRWIPDPGIELPPEEEDEAQPSRDESDSSTSSDTTTPTGNNNSPPGTPDEDDIPSGFGPGGGR